MTLKTQLKSCATTFTLLLSSFALCLSACTPIAKGEQANKDLKYKFRGINGLVLKFDAVSEKRYVTITNEDGRYIASPASLAIKKDLLLDYAGSRPIPKAIHVKWRSEKDGKAIWGKGGGIDYEGTIIGDYTVPVAERIPDELLDDLRKNRRGNLRIKIRLAEDRVLIGWDIMREGKGKYTFDYEMAGGDFREARIYNGKVDRKGWYIDKNVQKIETDY